MPKQIKFYELLLDAVGSLKKMSALFVEFAKEFKNHEQYAKRAKEIEHEADTKTHTIIDKLNRTFITPFDREDIYMLAHEMDDIADLIENVMHNIGIYRITKKVKAVEDFALLINEAVIQFEKLMLCLQKQKHNEELVNIKIKIHELEDKGDVIFNNAVVELFEQQTDPVLIMKLKDLFEDMENTMDTLQKVADLVEGIVVKGS